MDANELGLPPDIVNRILSGRQDADEATKEQREEHLEKVREIAAQYRSTFNNPAGRAVLLHLRSITIEQSAFVPGIQFHGCDGLSAAQNGFMREGQNSIVREIERYLSWEEPES